MSLKLTRPDLANYLIGAGVSIAALSLWAHIGIVGAISWIVAIAVSAAFGWGAAVGFNILQGQNHQTGNSANAEEKRSAKGAIVATLLVSIIIAVFTITNYVPLIFIGIGIVVFSIALWGIPTLIAKYNK